MKKEIKKRKKYLQKSRLMTLYTGESERTTKIRQQGLSKYLGEDSDFNRTIKPQTRLFNF